MKRTRTALAKRNAVFSVCNRALSALCGFACRSVFIKTLGKEYLGAGGMFGNIFSFVSFVELGFGAAISQSLYAPLAEGDQPRLAGILSYYAKIYRRMAWVTAALCVALLPLLPQFFPDIVKIPEYRAVFALFAFHELLSYYFAPKRALVLADQRMYAVMAVRNVTTVLAGIAQIVLLHLTHSYLVYIFLRILFLSIDGFAVNAYADRVYPYLHSLRKTRLSGSYKRSVWNSTRALMLHRVGSIAHSSTDSILISAHMGLAHMGAYSNYALVISSLGSFVALAVGAASAGIGNLGATASKEKSLRVLRKLCFFNFVMLTNVTVLLAGLIDPFITLWLGEGHTLGAVETSFILAGFYMSYIRDPVQIYLHSYGVFRATGILYLVRGISNLVLSYVLVGRFGAVGAFAGTLASTVLTAFIGEVPLLFHAVFKQKGYRFMREYYTYPLVAFVVCGASRYVCQNVCASPTTIAGMLPNALVSLLVCNASLALLYARTDRFRALWQTLRPH